MTTNHPLEEAIDSTLAAIVLVGFVMLAPFIMAVALVYVTCFAAWECFRSEEQE